MSGRDKSGRNLERLVATLERIFAGTGARVEAPSRSLHDRDTGRRREHDVLLIWDHGHHQIATAIECRDRSRAIGVPAVEAFADKCKATGVHSGVMVSATGFTATARTKAAARGITCMDLAEVPAFNWLAMHAIVGYQRKFGLVNVQIMFREARPDTIAAVFDTSGRELSEQDIFQTVLQQVPPAQNPETEVGTLFPVELELKTIDWTARDAQGAIWPIDHLLAWTSYTTLKTIHEVQTHRYTGGGKDYAIASTDATIGDISGKFVMVRDEDEGISVHWAPADPAVS